MRKSFNTFKWHSNKLNLNKRTVHTKISAKILKSDKLTETFGVMGSKMTLIDEEKNLLIGASDFRKYGCVIGY